MKKITLLLAFLLTTGLFSQTKLYVHPDADNYVANTKTIAIGSSALATGNIKYNSAVQSISIGTFGTTFTVTNSSGNPSPAFLDMRVVGANYAVNYQASIVTTTNAGLSSTFDSSGLGSGLATFNGTASTDGTGSTQFYVNMKTNSNSGDNTFTLTFTFDDETTATDTSIDFTVEGTGGGGGGSGPGGGGGGAPPPGGGEE